MMSLKDFIIKYKLKNKAESNLKIYQLLLSLSLNDIGIYSRDELFKTDIGIVNLLPSEETHWVAYMNEN